MQKIGGFLQTFIGLVLTAALAGGLALLFRAMGGGQAAQGYPPPEATWPPASPTPIGYPPPATLPHIGATVVAPPPTVVDLSPPQSRTPWLTFTPPPQPTRRPGPTETPLPLSSPAQDAAGFIVFTSGVGLTDEQGARTVSAFTLPVDSTGQPVSSTMRLTQQTELDLSLESIHPSPDGSRLALDGEWGYVAILNTITGAVEPLARLGTGGAGSFLGWHPDNRRILYRGDGDYDAGLWLVGPDDAAVLVIERSSVAIRDAAMSPDGQQVVYSYWGGFGGIAQLRLMNADGSDARVIYEAESDIGLLSWSPDGRWIAFLGGGGYMLMDANGTNARPLPISGFAADYSFEPVWSPDSRAIAFVSQEGPLIQGGDRDPFRDKAIRVINVITDEERLLLADGSTGHIDPAWSPDGAQLAFVSTRSGAPEVWAVNADGTGLRQLTNNGQFVRWPVWRRP